MDRDGRRESAGASDSRACSGFHSRRAFIVLRGMLSRAVIVLLLSCGMNTAAAPFTPASDEQVLEKLPATDRRSDSTELKRLHARLEKDPASVRAATELARRYIELARQHADPRYDGYAQAALQPWWKVSDAPTEVLVLRAVLLQRRHDFDAALADLGRVLSRRPTHAQALLTRASLHEVRGDYAEAMEDCLRLRYSASMLIAATCRASVSARTGHAQKAFQVLNELVSETADSSTAWPRMVLADIAVQMGREDAGRHIEKALAHSPDDPYLLALQADHLLQQERFAQVRDLLHEHRQIDALLLRLAIAEARSTSRERDQAKLASYVRELDRRFEAGRRRGDTIHHREEAMFELYLKKDPAAALPLAEENWREQREPIDAVVLLEAALAVGEDPKAAQSIEAVRHWLQETGLEHARLEPLLARAEQAQ